MAEHPAEVAEITRSSHALALNLGNITDARMKSMPESLKIAASLHIPVMLDLVGTACSNLRYEFAQKLMNIHMPELLKGNMSELLAISGQTAHAIGIDAGVQDVLTDANRSHLKELFQEKASQWNTTLLITGKEDMIVSASKCEFITNGTPAMSQITGTGCMLGMICATYLAVTDSFTAAVSAAREFGTAGERAEKNSSGPGSFQTELFDQFYNLFIKKVPVRQYGQISSISSAGTFFILFPHCAFFPSSRLANTIASANAAASAIGPAYITPSIPINNGKIMINGRRKITCRVRDITIPSFAIPIEVKKPEDTGWIPFAKVININIFR